MLKWNISQYGGRKRKIFICLCDILIAKKCFSKIKNFKGYKKLIEYGKDYGPIFPEEIIEDLLNGIYNVDWSKHDD